MTEPEAKEGEVDLLAILNRNIQLEDMVAELRGVIRTLSGDSELSKKIIDYLPQLTHISTNISATASAVQNNNGMLGSINANLLRIAEALEPAKSSSLVLPVTNIPASPMLTPPPTDAERRRLAAFRNRSCNCDGVSHMYQPGYCPPEGPKL